MARSKVGKTVGSLGDYLKEQRTASRLSLRQLAEQAGVSNPYLSQIERGLRRPSAEVLQQIAKALRISAEQLYIRAGIVSPEDGVGGSVELAVLTTPGSPSARSSRCWTSTRRSSPSTRTGPTWTPRHLIDQQTQQRPPEPPEVRSSDMAKAKFDIKTVPTQRAIYAAVGVTDLAVGVVRELRRRRCRSASPTCRRTCSSLRAAGVRQHQRREPTKDAKARRRRSRQRVAELQAEAARPVQTLVERDVDRPTPTPTWSSAARPWWAGSAARSPPRPTVKSAETTVDQGQDHQDPGHQGGQEDRHRRQEEHHGHGQEAHRCHPQQRQGDRHLGQEDRVLRGQRRRPTLPRRSATDSTSGTHCRHDEPPSGTALGGSRHVQRRLRTVLNVFAVEGITMLVIEIVLLAVTIFAFVSSLLFSDEAYRAAGKLNKPAWTIILGLGVAGPGHARGLAAQPDQSGLQIAALVYLADVKPALSSLDRAADPDGHAGAVRHLVRPLALLTRGMHDWSPTSGPGAPGTSSTMATATRSSGSSCSRTSGCPTRPTAPRRALGRRQPARRPA